MMNDLTLILLLIAAAMSRLRDESVGKICNLNSGKLKLYIKQ